jgi:hypothetical protein
MRRVGGWSVWAVVVLAAAAMIGASAAPEPDAPSAPPEAPAPGRPGDFPSPGDLERLGEPPAAAELFTLDVQPVEEWKLEGPFPERVGALPHAEEGPWSGLLSRVAEQRAGLVVPTEGMYCAARELGRFFLAQRGRPDDSLRRFILGRCHTTVSDVGFGYVDGRVDPNLDEAALFEQWRATLESTIEQGVQGGPRSVGIWFGRRGEDAVALVAFGPREVRVEPFSPFADADGRVEIRGEALLSSARVSALVNRGRFGVADCERLPGADFPRFHFACQVDPKDRVAAIALTVTPPERLLSRAGLSVLAWPGEETVDVYRAPHYADPSPVEEGSAVAPAFVDLLNRVRRRAGLQRVELDPRQSEAAAGLAPHFFAALFDRAPEFTADLVVLGMIAGWGVDGIVESGHFSAAWVTRSNDLSRLLSTALEYPVSREALLAPDIDRVAVGSLLETSPGSEALAAVFGTYSLFEAETHEEIARRVYEKLESDRRERGLGAPRRLDSLAGLCRRAASLVQGGNEPADAMNALLRESVDILRAPVSGWVAEVRDLDGIEFPQEYLTSPTLRVAVAVSHRRDEGEPWGHYVVMLVVSDPEAWGA